MLRAKPRCLIAKIYHITEEFSQSESCIVRKLFKSVKALSCFLWYCESIGVIVEIRSSQLGHVFHLGQVRFKNYPGLTSIGSHETQN